MYHSRCQLSYFLSLIFSSIILTNFNVSKGTALINQPLFTFGWSCPFLQCWYSLHTYIIVHWLLASSGLRLKITKNGLVHKTSLINFIQPFWKVNGSKHCSCMSMNNDEMFIPDQIGGDLWHPCPHYILFFTNQWWIIITFPYPVSRGKITGSRFSIVKINKIINFVFSVVKHITIAITIIHRILFTLTETCICIIWKIKKVHPESDIREVIKTIIHARDPL